MARTKSVNFPNTESEIGGLLDKIQRALTNRCIVTGALAIHGASSAVAKIVNTVYYMIDGTYYSKTAADTSALVGTVTNAKFNVFVFTLNAAGTFHTYMGTEGAAVSNVVFPTIPDGEVSVGWVIVNPTGTGNFVGGTTALDDGTVVPTAVYQNSGDGFNFNLSTL
jgi:hypothetical protein